MKITTKTLLFLVTTGFATANMALAMYNDNDNQDQIPTKKWEFSDLKNNLNIDTPDKKTTSLWGLVILNAGLAIQGAYKGYKRSMHYFYRDGANLVGIAGGSGLLIAAVAGWFLGGDQKGKIFTYICMAIILELALCFGFYPTKFYEIIGGGWQLLKPTLVVFLFLMGFGVSIWALGNDYSKQNVFLALCIFGLNIAATNYAINYVCSQKEIEIYKRQFFSPKSWYEGTKNLFGFKKKSNVFGNILIGVVLIFLIGGGYFFFQEKKSLIPVFQPQSSEEV